MQYIHQCKQWSMKCSPARTQVLASTSSVHKRINNLSLMHKMQVIFISFMIWAVQAFFPDLHLLLKYWRLLPWSDQLPQLQPTGKLTKEFHQYIAVNTNQQKPVLEKTKKLTEPVISMPISSRTWLTMALCSSSSPDSFIMSSRASFTEWKYGKWKRANSKE